MEKEVYKEMEIDDTFIKMVQQKRLETICATSCKPRKKEIKGEVYVSKKTSRQDRIVQAKKAIYAVAAFAVIGVAAKVGGDIDAATDIRKEVVRQETTLNSNGTYTTDRVYDDGFVEAVIDMRDGALIKLFDETSKEMIANGDIEGSRVVSEVVDVMEDNYVEEHGKAK